MIENRGKKYVGLMIASVIIPFIVTMVIIIATGDRIEGMKNFPIPSIVLIHLIFALTQLETPKYLMKILFGFLAAIFATSVTLIPMFLDLKLRLDMYGFWDLIVFFTIGTLGAWEVLYQLDKRRNKKTHNIL